MSFDNSASNYFISSDHKLGDDLDYASQYFKNTSFSTVLDIASGAGHFLKVINADKKVLYDISYNMLKECRKGYNYDKLVNGSVTNLPFKNNTFEMVSCRIAFHHFRSPQSVINEIYSVLKIKGIFILIDSIVDIEDAQLNCIEFIRDNSHYRSNSVKEIIDFTSNKFRLVHFNNFYKKHDFIQWAERLGADKAKVSEISTAFLNLSEEIKQELKLKLEDGNIKSYTDKKGLFIFEKL